MAGQDLVGNLISALGQSQRDRLSSALDAHFVDVDERSTEDWYRFLKRFSAQLNFYQNDADTVGGTWENFFPFAEGGAQNYIGKKANSVPPHLALLHSFLELYREPQALANQLTARHLDFFYRDILRFGKKPPVPDRAHVVLQLKKNVEPVLFTAQQQLSGGKDASGVELIYQPLKDAVINHSAVASLRSVFRDASQHDTLRTAPIANSADGLGTEFDTDEPKWHGFGHAQLPLAEVGFALSSPVLRLAEGTRKISVVLKLANVTSDNLIGANLTDAFKIYLSAEKSWIGPITTTPVRSGSQLQFDINIAATEAAIIDYAAAVHGYQFGAGAPVLQVMLNNSLSALGPEHFRGVVLDKAKIAVEVSGLTNLNLENDNGTLNPKKAFMPFGPLPKKGSRFIIGCDEVFGKKLTEVSVTLQWKSPPASFASHYANYGKASDIDNDYFTVNARMQDAGDWSLNRSSQRLFDSDNATEEHTLTLSAAGGSGGGSSGGGSGGSPSNSQMVYTLSSYSAQWAQLNFFMLLLQSPLFYSLGAALPPAKSGTLTLSLEQDFLHADYRKEYVANVMAYSKQDGTTPALVVLNEPYTPEVQGISLGYKAYSDEVSLTTQTLAEFAKDDVQFYYVDCFGQMREHAYQRSLFSYLSDKTVSLFPDYSYEGNLYVGIEKLSPGDSCSLLFQVAEGSADPDLPPPDIDWSVLCDNYWKPLSSDELVADTTNGLLTSGLVSLVIPTAATTTNTLLPAGYIWIRASVAENVGAVCQLVDVIGNAVEVVFVDRGNDPRHLATALPAKSIAKLKTPLAGIKKVSQPYASFDGQLEEDDVLFRTRVAERLRHKNRPQTAWDIERRVLGAFHRVHKVKCIPHAKPGNWLTPGNVTLVVIPDLTNKNVVDPLQPRVDSNTISEIGTFLAGQSGMQVSHHVCNPMYQQVKASFKVKFKQGYEFNFYRQQLDQAIKAYLSPWAFSDGSSIEFGGKVYKSVLLDYIEELAYVDFLTDVKLYTYVDESEPLQDTDLALPRAPDAILVSAYGHDISEY